VTESIGAGLCLGRCCGSLLLRIDAAASRLVSSVSCLARLLLAGTSRSPRSVVLNECLVLHGVRIVMTTRCVGLCAHHHVLGEDLIQLSFLLLVFLKHYTVSFLVVISLF
jgi:hypothetical protein